MTLHASNYTMGWIFVQKCVPPCTRVCVRGNECVRAHWYIEVLYKWFLTPFSDGVLNRRQVSDCDRGGPSHMTQKPSGIVSPGTHARQNEVVCDGQAIKYDCTGPIGSGRKYIPHNQSQTNVSVCYVHSTQSIQGLRFRSYVHPTQSIQGKCFRSYVHPTQSIQGKHSRSYVHPT
jgi:hypothetical protein